MPEPMAARSTIDSTSSTSSYEELPLFFPSVSQALYGVFYAPVGDRKDSVLVFSHSLGIEHMVTQRMEVLWARAAAKAGFAVFRYNARGHGDSAGDARDVAFTDLVDDACAAADYARMVSGTARIVWVGVRFGCLIAAAAMARRDDAVALALWEPLHQGGEYFRAAIRTVLFCQVAQGKRSGATVDDLLERLELDGALPVVGTYLYSSLWRSAHHVDLAGQHPSVIDGARAVPQRVPYGKAPSRPPVAAHLHHEAAPEQGRKRSDALKNGAISRPVWLLNL